MKENRIDHELFRLEDEYVAGKIDALTALVDGHHAIERFQQDNPDKRARLTVRSPRGEEFTIDVTDLLPTFLLGMAFEHYKVLKDLGLEQKAKIKVDELNIKWKKT